METLCNASGLKASPKEAPPPFEQLESGLDPKEYFTRGHFTAAIQSTTELIPNSTDVGVVLQLWYIRIQSLLFLQLGHQAAEETHTCLAPLETEEFLNTLPDNEAKLVAWKLKLILVPVRTKGINQSAIQLYYSLGADARANACEGYTDKWLSALKLAGIYTVSALIAMRDYLTVIHLLTVQYNAVNDDETAQLLAMIYIYIGDTLSARAWVARLPQNSETAKLKALYTFADADSSENILPVVSEIYSGRVNEAIAKLEAKVTSDSGVAMNTDLTNLFTLYDLCYPDSRQRRAQLAEKLVAGGNKYLENIELSNSFRRSLSHT